MALLRRKRTSLKKRSSRRLMRKPRMLTQGKLYKFKRTCELKPYYFNGVSWVQQTTNIVSNGTGSPSISGIFKFRLEDLPSPTDFTQLYEQFRITGVKLRFIPFIGTESSSVATTWTETLAMAIDRGANDAIAVSPSFSTLLENQDVKLRNSQRPFTMWIGSPVAHQGLDSYTQLGYRPSPWVDSELPNSRLVDHQGLKYAFQGTRSEETSCQFRVFATYYITCRNPQ